jgi:signal transduction histidine kinase/CheY-like chemotaxis protein
MGMACAALFSLLSLLVARGRETCPGFRHWTYANICAAAGLLLVGLRGLIPDLLSIGLGNTATAGAFVLIIEGARRFRGEKRIWWPAPAIVAVSLAGIGYYRWHVDDLNARIELLCLSLGVVSAAAAWDFSTQFRPGYRLSIGFTATVLVGYALGQFARAAHVMTHPLTNLYAPSPAFAALLMGAVLGVIAWSFGFFMINHDHAVEHLKLAQSRAAQADAAKSEFLANVSHEIRTPMNGVMGLTELLLDTPLDDLQRDYAETVRESGLALLDIVNDLLDISKIEAGKIEMVESPFAPREVVKKIADLLAWNARHKGLALSFHIAPEVPQTLIGDAGRLRQVLTNLAGNAIKFTGRGSVEMNVSLEDRGLLRFSVTDTGPGIGKADQARLFERFEQAGHDPRRGTGLGLAISKELVERMGGRMGVESEEGKGSTFWFTAVFRTQSTYENLALRVLVVDDSPVNQRVAAALLEKVGCQTRVASNGRAAVELVAKEPFDLILMDCQMPDLDGYQATRLIRRTSAVPILAMTASVQAQDRERCIEAGMDGHIAKPVSLGSITEAVTKCLSSRHA